MKPVPKPRLTLSETDENIVVESVGVCFMFTGDGDNEQKQTESLKTKRRLALLKKWSL